MEATQGTVSQGIFKFADDVDINGERTIGVMTKCDLVPTSDTDRDAFETVCCTSFGLNSIRILLLMISDYQKSEESREGSETWMVCCEEPVKLGSESKHLAGERKTKGVCNIFRIRLAYQLVRTRVRADGDYSTSHWAQQRVLRAYQSRVPCFQSADAENSSCQTTTT